VRTSKDADYLLQQSKQEAHKAREALCNGDSADTIYLHRENAVRYYARAMAVMRPSTALH
jgi:hypothetical protein